MTEAIVLTVPARHLTTGDYFNGMTVMSIDRFVGKHCNFTLVIPHTTHTMVVSVQEKDLDAISFPLTKRGDDYSPNARNAALGLPPVTPVVTFTRPEPVAVYPAGTLMKHVKHFDRSIKVNFHCPTHPGNVWCSKDPYSSSWFSVQGTGCECIHHVGDYIVSTDYKPTRNG